MRTCIHWDPVKTGSENGKARNFYETYILGYPGISLGKSTFEDMTLPDRYGVHKNEHGSHSDPTAPMGVDGFVGIGDKYFLDFILVKVYISGSKTIYLLIFFKDKYIPVLAITKLQRQNHYPQNLL